MCCPTNEGGLGLRNLRDVRQAFIFKKCWLIAMSILYGQHSCEISIKLLLLPFFSGVLPVALRIGYLNVAFSGP